ncbi:MAG: hypothetical protein FJ102_06525 [Deltaproteobacteria bacterium]|nr:hypothetical protein [Deltaproteobacteria bacterium]
MSHVSTLKLHQLRLGELPAEEAARCQAHVDGCALCQARLGHQAEVRRDFEAMPVPLAIARPRWQRVALGAMPLLAAAIVLLALFPATTTTTSTPVDETAPAELPAKVDVVSDADPVATPEPVVAPEPAAPAPTTKKATTRTKGASIPRLEAWVEAGESERPVYPGESLGAGARVQLRYDALGKNFVTLAGRDSDGVVEVYATIAAGARGLQSAPFALTLDDSKGEQAFFALLSDTRLDPEAVKTALSRNPVRMDGAIVTSLVLRKD